MHIIIPVCVLHAKHIPGPSVALWDHLAGLPVAVLHVRRVQYMSSGLCQPPLASVCTGELNNQKTTENKTWSYTT